MNFIDNGGNQALYRSDETAYCIVAATHRFQVPPEAILAMMIQEAGKLGKRTKNSNGSYDLGPLQINQIWLSEKSPLYGLINEKMIEGDLCSNILVATWILSKHYYKTRDIWKAIGMYHNPGRKEIADVYIANVYGKLPTAKAIISSNRAYGVYWDGFNTGRYR